MQQVWISVHRFSCTGKYYTSLFSVNQPDFTSYLPALQIDGKFQLKYTWSSFLFSLQRAVLRFCAFIECLGSGNMSVHMSCYGDAYSPTCTVPSGGPLVAAVLCLGQYLSSPLHSRQITWHCQCSKPRALGTWSVFLEYISCSWAWLMAVLTIQKDWQVWLTEISRWALGQAWKTCTRGYRDTKPAKARS